MMQATRRKPPTPPLSPRLSRMLREAILYGLSALAIYLFISLLTYNANDPAWSNAGKPGVTTNFGGPMGAWTADILFHLCGYVAYLFPVMVAFSAGRIFLNRHKPMSSDVRQRTIVFSGFLLTIFSSSGLAHLHFTGVAGVLPFSLGGILGTFIGSALAAGFSDVGATIFLLALFLAGMTLFTGLSWLKAMDNIGRFCFWLFAWSKYGLSRVRDHIEGRRAKSERQESLVRQKIKIGKKTVPRVDPVIAKIIPGARVEQEKQMPLFRTPEGAELPPLSLLDATEKTSQPQFSKQSLETMSRLVEKKLLDFDIEAQVVAIHPGPVITRFELEPGAGIKASQITNLANDLARSLSVISVRVVENIPGKAVIGLEVPNETREVVRLREILSSQDYDEIASPLSLALGKGISGQPVIVDLAKMPHLLIAGTTGSGKSVCVNALIMSLIYKSTPEQVRMIMVDPKMIELAVYEGIPHLLAPVVTDMQQAANALRWCIFEMERRYRLMAALGVRNISGYNRKIKQAKEAGKPILDPIASVPEGESAEALETLPYIVIIIDELADMMMMIGKKVEQLIARLAQKARAAGLHLLVATQRPSVDVVTGLIKANIPARIAFQMSSRVDSRTVLDQMGAEQLLGQGDMLFLQPGLGVPMRVHGAFVADHEVHKVSGALKKKATPSYNETILSAEQSSDDKSIPTLSNTQSDDDPLYQDALKVVLESKKASISGVQRRLRIGYNRAARLVEQMEQAGIVGPLQSNGVRDILVKQPITEE